MAKCLASRIVGNAEVRLSTETSMVGGSAQRCVADSPSRPAGPLAERAVTMVLPVARWPIACQNCLTSTVPGLSGMNIHHIQMAHQNASTRPKLVTAASAVQD